MGHADEECIRRVLHNEAPLGGDVDAAEVRGVVKESLHEDTGGRQVDLKAELVLVCRIAIVVQALDLEDRLRDGPGRGGRGTEPEGGQSRGRVVACQDPPCGQRPPTRYDQFVGGARHRHLKPRICGRQHHEHVVRGIEVAFGGGQGRVVEPGHPQPPGGKAGPVLGLVATRVGPINGAASRRGAARRVDLPSVPLLQRAEVPKAGDELGPVRGGGGRGCRPAPHERGGARRGGLELGQRLRRDGLHALHHDPRHKGGAARGGQTAGVGVVRPRAVKEVAEPHVPRQRRALVPRAGDAGRDGGQGRGLRGADVEEHCDHQQRVGFVAADGLRNGRAVGGVVVHELGLQRVRFAVQVVPAAFVDLVRAAPAELNVLEDPFVRAGVCPVSNDGAERPGVGGRMVSDSVHLRTRKPGDFTHDPEHVSLCPATQFEAPGHKKRGLRSSHALEM